MKYYGTIGYGITSETRPGIWEEEVITERHYYGDIVKSSIRAQTASKINDDVSFSNEFSIVADPYAFENFTFIKYITYAGVKWKVTNVEIQYPRLIISIGGVYNG
ncbi:MAG: hypothetical protein IIY35_01955 [Ruminococcus sp.]|nr:hypothetical protein [Ruminococcus sp.]